MRGDISGRGQKTARELQEFNPKNGKTSPLSKLSLDDKNARATDHQLVCLDQHDF